MYESRIASGRLTAPAVEGYEMADLLFVRNPIAARVLARIYAPATARRAAFEGAPR